MLKRWMHKRERHFAFLNDNRRSARSSWERNLSTKPAAAATRNKIFVNIRKGRGKQRPFFFAPQIADYQIQKQSITIHDCDSRVDLDKLRLKPLRRKMLGGSPEFFASKRQNCRRAAALERAKAGAISIYCKVFQPRRRVGFERLTLPYHEEADAARIGARRLSRRTSGALYRA